MAHPVSTKGYLHLSTEAVMLFAHFGCTSSAVGDMFTMCSTIITVVRATLISECV